MAGLVLNCLKLKLAAERAKDAESPCKFSTRQGALLFQPDGLGLGLSRAGHGRPGAELPEAQASG
jgi:hypothetical protein